MSTGNGNGARSAGRRGNGGKGKRIRPMTATDVADLPEPCGRCTFWQSSLSDLACYDGQADRSEVKLEWASAVTERWGYCGVRAVDNGSTIATLTMAPAVLVPRLATFATTPVSQDAAVLVSLRVLEEYRGHGIGRQLIQAGAGLLVRRDIRAFEAVGTYRDGPSCMLPATWLESVGFEVVRAHPVTPRLRMNLQSTLRWKPDLGAAWSRLTDLVAQPAPPEPNGAWREATPNHTP